MLGLQELSVPVKVPFPTFYQSWAHILLTRTRFPELFLIRIPPAYFETVEHFGRKILSCDGTINRKELAKIVFNNKAELEVLNRITHKYIFIKMQNMIDKYISASGSGDMIVLDVPLLFSDDFNIKYDKSVVVTASREIIIKRVMLRDGMDESEILSRIKNQLTDEELIKRADFVIENNYENIDELRTCVTGIYKELISLNT